MRQIVPRAHARESYIVEHVQSAAISRSNLTKTPNQSSFFLLITLPWCPRNLSTPPLRAYPTQLKLGFLFWHLNLNLGFPLLPSPPASPGLPTLRFHMASHLPRQPRSSAVVCATSSIQAVRHNLTCLLPYRHRPPMSCALWRHTQYYTVLY